MPLLTCLRCQRETTQWSTCYNGNGARCNKFAIIELSWKTFRRLMCAVEKSRKISPVQDWWSTPLEWLSSTHDLDLDFGSGNMAYRVHHSPSSIYTSNFIKIGKTFFVAVLSAGTPPSSRSRDTTSSSAIAEVSHDALWQLKSCQLLHNCMKNHILTRRIALSCGIKIWSVRSLD